MRGRMPTPSPEGTTMSQNFTTKAKIHSVGTDNHTVYIQTRGSRARVICTCARNCGDWQWNHTRVSTRADVHARLHHGYQPDRGKWRNPNG